MESRWSSMTSAAIRERNGMADTSVGAIAADAPGAVLHVFDHSFPINDGYAFRSGEIIRFLRRSGWRTGHVTSAKQGPSAAPREAVEGLEFYRTQPSRMWGNV